MKKIIASICFSVLVLCSFAQTPVEPIRGTWVTNVASDALMSLEKVKQTVATCKQKKLNSIFVVVWNGGVTMYPSKVMQDYIGIAQDTVYKSFDPIAAIVEEGHKQGLKVHAWFEFGFSFAYKDSNSIWKNKYPHWIAKNNLQQPLAKNGFYWWNAIHPEVQLFMKQLVKEVVAKYNVDGFQGDDRLPAMPAEGGYDHYTTQLYLSETGKMPPADCREKQWLQWKANQLSSFGKSLYQLVKKERPNCLVTWSPSIYPWSKEQYLQDWPTWVKDGYADYILPQLYRYNIAAYEKVLLQLKQQVTPAQMQKVFPGILTSLGDGYLVNQQLLKEMIQLNRKHGFMGECLFYYESLNKLPSIY